MNILFWSAFGLIIFGVAVVVLAAVKGNPKLNLVGVAANLTGSLAYVAYYSAKGSFLAILFAAMVGLNVFSFVLSYRAVRLGAAAK